MTTYLQSPDSISIAPDFSGIALPKVPKGYYRIGQLPSGEYILLPVEPLQLADKIYGSLLQHVPRIEEVFAQRTTVATTVLLEGLKGSGKSLLMKTLATRFVENEDGIVILIDRPHAGPEFFAFLQQIEQKKVILMDEFDKVYRNEDMRNQILTLLDGNYASHTMYIITMNASSSGEGYEFFHNRPGRVYFSLNFTAVDYEAIKDYLEDCLTDKSLVAEVLQFTKRFTKFNMDMLGTLVREINAVQDKTIEEIAEYLNVKPDISLDDIYFDVKIVRDGLDITNSVRHINDDYWKNFVKQATTRERNETINIMVNSSRYCTVTKKPLPRDPSEWTTEQHENNLYGIRVMHEGTPVLVESFDEYIYANQAELSTDTKTGAKIITVKSDEDTNYVITLTPKLRKSYSYLM